MPPSACWPPGVYFAFLWKRANAIGVVAGIIAGYIALLLPQAQALWSSLLPGWEQGLVAMAINAAVVAIVSIAFPSGRVDKPVVG